MVQGHTIPVWRTLHDRAKHLYEQVRRKSSENRHGLFESVIVLCDLPIRPNFVHR
jgi:hypothetical protein